MKRFGPGFMLTALLSLFVFSCDKNGNDDPPVETIFEILEAPQFLLGNVDSVYTYRVRYTGDVLAADTVRCTILRPDGFGVQNFDLFDDGGTATVSDPPFASETSLDIVPGNGTYTRGINGQLLSSGGAGRFIFDFEVVRNGNSLFSISPVEVDIANVEDCIFESFDEIHEMNECFDPVTISAQLATTTPDVVDTLRVILMQNDEPVDTARFSPTDADSVWEIVITPSTFPCAGTATDYSMTLDAVTRFGRRCETEIADISIINDDQEIDSLFGLPDTLWRPPFGETDDTMAVTLDLLDCNLLGILGYNGVRFDVKKDDSVWVHAPDYFLNDAGLSGDTVAGNGTYTVALTFSPDSSNLNNVFLFRYYSIECAPPFAQTDYLYDTLRLIQPDPPVLLSSDAGVERIGFGVVPVRDDIVMTESRLNK